jgi:hypothetical protein
MYAKAGFALEPAKVYYYPSDVCKKLNEFEYDLERWA